MSITFTEWWDGLASCFISLNLRFPKASLGDHRVFRTALKMATCGVQMESAWMVYPLAKSMLEDEKQLGTGVPGLAGETNYLPDVHTPSDAIVAVAYYDHLDRFQEVKSSSSTLQKGALGFPGLDARKDMYLQHAKTLQDKIVGYLQDQDKVKALIGIDSRFQSLLAIAHFADRFTAFSSLTLNSIAPIGLDTPASDAESTSKTFEEKLGGAFSAAV